MDNTIWKKAMRLLSEVAKGRTQRSIVYYMTDGGISVVIGQGYQIVNPSYPNREIVKDCFR
jgi:hypothetical protein